MWLSTWSTRRHDRPHAGLGPAHAPRGAHPDGLFPWDGREDNGRVAPDGTYYFRVALLHQNRTVEYTRVPVTVKSTPPHPVVTSVSPALIPQGGAPVQIRYRGNEQRAGTVRIYRTDLPGAPRAGQELPRRVAGRQSGTARSLSARRRPGPTWSASRSRTRPATPAGSRPRCRPCRARLRTPGSPSATWPPSRRWIRSRPGAAPPCTWTPASSPTRGRFSVRGSRRVLAHGAGRSFALSVRFHRGRPGSTCSRSVRAPTTPRCRWWPAPPPRPPALRVGFWSCSRRSPGRD